MQDETELAGSLETMCWACQGWSPLTPWLPTQLTPVTIIVIGELKELCVLWPDVLGSDPISAIFWLCDLGHIS